MKTNFFYNNSKGADNMQPSIKNLTTKTPCLNYLNSI